MKQRITAEQLDELTQSQKEKMRYWYINSYKKQYPYDEIDARIDSITFPLLNIGQMIEFLDEHLPEGHYHIQRNGERDAWRLWSDDFETNEQGTEELCDALWEVVKKVLNNNDYI